jgi:hypothetical protein
MQGTDWVSSPRHGPDDHGRLRAHLRKGKTQVLSERLDDLRQWRNECDYWDILPFDLALQASLAIESASQIFLALQPPLLKSEKETGP